MRFGGMPKEVGQCSYRVAKQLQPGLPPKLIHTVLSTLVLQGGLKSPPMSSSSATSPAELSLRPTLWRTRGNGRRTRPTTTSCARRTLKQPAWLALGRLLPVWPTIAVVPLVKMHRAGQPLRLCPLIENAQRWPTPSVVPLIENAPRLANPFGCPDQSKPTPLRLCLWSRCIALANHFGCARDQKCTASG
jgi:hypothetical protein